MLADSVFALMTGSPGSEADALCAALNALFPPRPITRAMLEEPTAGWEDYKGGDLVQQLEGRSWDELEPAFIEQHHSALRYTGPEAFGALLPAYLRHLLQHRAFNDIPFVVAGELQRYGNPVNVGVFDARIERLTAAQRAVVKRIVAFLTTREPMQAAMSATFESYWRSQEE